MGVALSLPVGVTVILASALAYASGFGLTMWPLLRSGMAFWPAPTSVFTGEAVSVGVMEVAMNVVHCAMGGMRVNSLFVSPILGGIGGCLPRRVPGRLAGQFLAAGPPREEVPLSDLTLYMGLGFSLKVAP